jgi:hypothetical protein
MNERIKLLKEQSMEWVPNMADPDTKIRLLNAGKFAELIVAECASRVDHILREKSNGGGTMGDEIKQHFGVEE